MLTISLGIFLKLANINDCPREFLAATLLGDFLILMVLTFTLT